MASVRDHVVSFVNQHGERLAGRFNDVPGSPGVVILCHGYCSSKNSPILIKVAKELQEKAKVAVLAFDFCGNGDSEGSLCFANYHKEVKDLQSAIGFVRKMLKREVLALVGHSKGANCVLLFASTFDGDVPLIVNLAGRYEMKRGVEERFGAELIEKIEKMGQASVTATRDDGKAVKYVRSLA
jgi:alpha/beta superfamily hydrolase